MWLFTSSILLILSISVISSAYSRRLLGNYRTTSIMFGRPLKSSSAIRLQQFNIDDDVVCKLIEIRLIFSASYAFLPYCQQIDDDECIDNYRIRNNSYCRRIKTGTNRRCVRFDQDVVLLHTSGVRLVEIAMVFPNQRIKMFETINFYNNNKDESQTFINNMPLDLYLSQRKQ